jgi:uncharacterized protein involved in outer membrane biogenesis
MRRLVWIGAGLVALLVAAVGIAALNLNRILGSQRPRIQAELSRALGREVSLGALAVSFRDGLAVQVSELSIAEDPALGKGLPPFVSAGEVLARVNLLPAIFGDLQVAQVRLVKPSVSVIQTARGLSIDTLGGGDAAKPASSEPAGPKGDSGDSSIALAIANVSIEDGSIRYVDRTAKPVATYQVDQLDFAAENLSLVEPAAFELEAALLGSKSVNAWLEGEVGPIRPTAAAESKVDLTLRLDPVTVAQLRGLPAFASALPPDFQAEGPLRLDAKAVGSGSALAIDATLDAAKARVRYLPALDKDPGEPLRFVFRGEKQGNDFRIERADLRLGQTELATTGIVKNLDAPTIEFESKAPRLVASEFGLDSKSARKSEELRDVVLAGTIATSGPSPVISARLRSSGGSLRNADYQNLDARLAMRDQRAAIESLALDALGGKVQGRGNYDMSRAEKPVFDMAWDLAGVRLEELVATQTEIGARFIDGELSTDLAVNGSGSTWEQIKPVLAGLGNATVKGGLLRNINVADQTLQSITGVPGLTNMLSPKLRDRYKGLLSAADTAFDDLSGALQIRDGAIHLPGIELRASDFGVRGAGRLTLDADLDLDATLIASPALTTSLLEEAKPVKYLVNQNGALEIPLHISGGLPTFEITPDTKFVARVLERALVGGAVDKLLGEAAKRAPGAAKSEDGSAVPAAPGAIQDPAAAIEQGLRGLLGKKKKKAEPAASEPAAPEATAPSGAPESTPDASSAPAPAEPAETPPPAETPNP